MLDIELDVNQKIIRIPVSDFGRFYLLRLILDKVIKVISTVIDVGISAINLCHHGNLIDLIEKKKQRE